MADESTPINVDVTKILDWLKSRRHIPENWGERLQAIRKKIAHAILDVPKDDVIFKMINIKTLQNVTYNQCLKILKSLEETGEGTKTMLGTYKSKRMQDWYEICQLYQKDNIYLAEGAALLRNYASREIPDFKRQIHKLEERQAEHEKQIKDGDKSEAVSQKRFNAACEQLGIQGDNIKMELTNKLKELPKLYEEIADKIKTVEPAIALYKAFNKYLSGSNTDTQIMTVLIYVIEHGNTTTYEFLYGEKPLRIEELKYPQLGEKDKKSSNEPKRDENAHVQKDQNKTSLEDSVGGKEDEIDFGDKGGEIDFGDQIVIESPENVEQNIGGSSSRGSSNEESFEIINYDEFSEDPDINLEASGIVLEESGNIVEETTGIVLEESGIVVEKSEEGAIARGEEALTVLDNPKYQDEIINDLSELEAFLKIRVFEMSCESDLLSISQMQKAPMLLQMQTLETVIELADCVNVALTEMTSKRIRHLHNIKHSPNYVDLLIQEFQQHLSVISRKKSSKKNLEKKIAIIGAEIRKLENFVKWAVADTKKMQQDVEGVLSKIYKGRKVNIVGCINNL